ncbi:T9SS type A sorting domain-containing protein [Neolewinella aurantiaca]|uniref:T9SS type A sorting domain-containing protein n=1 Tax=Neolewinella aurantiaca TaxID=2602767 RepID=A0A5C7FI42_9BACT|nr:T9SS type A sorting domain-containing protein [Neolewinella aurantiaca]TXF90902.1 T9SS type A sorting domain-containing protein [Neolewinella aurantiaca]
MNVRLPLLSLFFLLAFLPVSAQTFRPLMGYEMLAPQPDDKAAPQFTKVDCEEFDLSAFELVAAGDTLRLDVGLDTAGLGGGPFTYVCDGCAVASSGNASADNDSLFYAADAGAELGLDTLRLSVCNSAGMCSTEKTFIVLVRRANEEISLGTFTVAPRGQIDIPFPDGDLPGGATCRTLEACATGYEGRGQDFYFLTGQHDGNEVRYRAAGLDGVDQVCVTLCNSFGICDTYTAGLSINVAPVDLPFFDDFAYEGVRPNPLLWQDDDVLINRNFAQDPPSIGVATFDGIDVTGQPYEGGSGGSRTVVRDYLTSAPVNAQDAIGTTLTFFLQPRGFGNRPETQDSFLVEFLDVDGNWNTVYQKEGTLNTVPNNQPLPFEPVLLDVPDEYLYNGFQFRFSSKSSEQGAVDMWHLDYVKLDTRPTRPVDLALRELPPFILENYTSMPLRHLQAGGEDLLESTLSISFQNLGEGENDAVTVTGATSLISIGGYVPGSTPSPNTAAILSPDVFGTGEIDENEFGPGEQTDRTTDFASIGGLYSLMVNNLLNQADPASAYKVDMSYFFDVVGETTNYLPEIAENNSLVRTTCFDNYMAYDDGTAEVSIEGGEGTTIVQQYEAFVADELLGVQIRIPRVLGSLGSQQLKLVIYTGEGQPDELVAEYDFDIRYAETYFQDSLQGYTTYIFPDVVSLDAGTFYVGWEQQNADRFIGVGFDRNNSPENVQWFDSGNGFMPLSGTTTGAIMIRPLLSGFEGFPTSVADRTDADALVDVFPNPTNGTLHLRARQTVSTSLSYRLFSLTGAVVGAGQVNETIELGHLPAGIYMLEVTDGAAASRHKIVRR